MPDTLSVVIPCYNQQNWIERAVSSVLSQSTRPYEVIVVDDGSTDRSLDVLQGFGDQIRVVRQPNRGASAARNSGLSRVGGTFVFFLDSDDYIEGDLLGAAVDALSEADVGFSPCVTERRSGDRETFFRFEDCPTAREVYERWLDFYSQPPCTIFWRTDFIRSIGGWDEQVSLNDDGEIIMRAMLSDPRLTSIRSGHGVYNAHSDPSLSKTRSVEALTSEFSAMHRLIDEGRAVGWNVEGFQRKMYIIARGAFQIGQPNLGEVALATFREIGGRGHYGSMAHIFLSTLLGLNRKMRIANGFHDIRLALERGFGFLMRRYAP